jgi:hypothetical protein
LKPALKKAIENLIPTIAKHLGDLAGKITVWSLMNNEFHWFHCDKDCV